jgi:hypothetical protein
MTTLVYSERCQHCYDLIEYIKTQPALHNIVTYQNIDDDIPEGVTKVPSLLTTSGKIYVGKEVKDYLRALVPNKLEKLVPHKGGYPIKRETIRPVMTPELEQKISQSVEQGLLNLKR